jgi:hypothetical protein
MAMPIKPSDKEEQFFYEQEAKRLREKAAQEQAGLAAGEKKRGLLQAFSKVLGKS